MKSCMGVITRGLALGSVAIALVALIVRARTYWPFTVDDSFITLRYAKHLAEGLGPTWNPAGPAVEGYTTALWMLVLAVPHALGLNALVFAKLCGVVAAIAALLFASLLAHELTRERDVRVRALAVLSPFALSVAYWPLALHAISGMETALSAALLTLFGLVSVRHQRAPTRLRGRSLSLLALACALTRPELALASGITLIGVWRALARPDRKVLVRVAALYLALPGVCYFVARYAYFGLPLPLSFYVKATGQARFAGLSDVGEFFAPFVLGAPHVAALALYGALSSRALLPLLAGLASCALFFVFPAHVMGFESRYLLPLFPCLAALAGAGLAKLSARVYAAFATRPRLSPWLELGSVAVAWLLFASLALPAHERTARARWLDYGSGLTRAHVAFAEALKKARLSVLRPRIALLDVGAVGYYSDWYVIDTFGLNDAHVALAERGDVDYVLAQAPELIVLVSAEPSRFVPVFDWERPLEARAAAAGYAPLCTYDFEPGYQLLVLARPGSLLVQSLDCPRVLASSGETPRAAR